VREGERPHPTSHPSGICDPVAELEGGANSIREGGNLLLEGRDYPPQIQRWYERLAPVVEHARDALHGVDPADVARRTGCLYEADGTLRLALFREGYTIQPATWTVCHRDTGEKPTEFTQALILTYLISADGTPPSGRWIGYRDLPDGMFYAQAFRGYAELRLGRELGDGGLARFRAAAAALHGTEIEIGDAGYAFTVLPHVHLGAVYWLGDEDFPSRTSILFEDTAPHYLSTDGLAVLGSHLVNALLDAAP
jgi:hypothetical protein